MINPYKFLRLRAGYAQKQFCDEYGFAKQTLISIEQGVYEELSTRMMTAIEDVCAARGVDIEAEMVAEYGTPLYTQAYRLYRLDARTNCDPRINDWVPSAPVGELSPMHFFVKETVGSVQGFAKALKVQTAILLSYITGRQKDMPAPLEEALMDANYFHIEALKKYQTEWIKEKG